MRYPKFLSENGTIGFVAPSFGCATEPYYSTFNNAQKKFQSMGYQLDLGPNCYLQKGIGISNTPQECGKELTDYYCSKENDMLISCGGGEMMCETMEYVDFEQIKAAEPKWYMGYSDNTNFIFLLTTICDTAAVYGPCVKAFGMEPWHESLFDAMGILTGTKKELTEYPFWEREDAEEENSEFAPYHVTEPLELVIYPGKPLVREWNNDVAHKKEDSVCWKTGETDIYCGVQNSTLSLEMKGRLLGGCTDCLVTLLGTRFDKVKEFQEKYQEDGIIWFLESCDLNVMAIRRAMWQMKNAGWFRYVKGFLIGRPYCMGQEMMGLDQYHAVVDILKEFEVPIIMDVDLGHKPPMMPLVSGSMAHITVIGNHLNIKMEYE